MEKKLTNKEKESLKDETDEFSYEFDGWSSDISCVCATVLYHY